MSIYSKDELEMVKKSGLMAYNTHMYLSKFLKPGITTAKLNSLAENFIKSNGGKPAFLGYQGFPASICTAVNDVIVHGIPRESEVLKDGDIIGIDLGINFNGYYSDTAWTWPIGNVSDQAIKIIEVTQKSLYLGLKQVLPNNKVGQIGEVVQTFVESYGYSVVRDLVGHGIGKNLHEPPQIPNYGHRSRGVKLKPGMIIAIEPMVNIGSYNISLDEDKWTIRTVDRELSAHFEHTVAVTSDGYINCTLPENSETNVFEIISQNK